MQWEEIRTHYPNQWLLLEALAAHTEGERRVVDGFAIVGAFVDSTSALRRYRDPHHESPMREYYVLHTSRESLDITERQWLGVRVHEACRSGGSSDPRIETVRVTDDEIVAELADGRTISVPLAWSWRLSEATPAQRANLRLIGAGQGVHWPEIDEDISVEGMLHGVPVPHPSVGRAPTEHRRAAKRIPSNKRTQPLRKRSECG